MSRKRKNTEINQNIEIKSIGSILSTAREKLNLTTGQIHHKTKIPASAIENLEAEKWENLPAPVYTKGFIKSYCRELGLNYDEIISLYPEQKDQTLKKIQEQIVISTAGKTFLNTDDKSGEEKESRVSTALVVFILFVLATLAVSYLASQKETDNGSSPSASEMAHPDVTT
ncbi:MAG: helix-turn-helix domain-containing protein [Deltaproteobacteria bacterium]|nr:helix-turn-helix domain-containing protein [Deltaproteobacteria bacterium]